MTATLLALGPLHKLPQPKNSSPRGAPSNPTGQCNVKRYNAYLRDMIMAGKAKPSFVVSHEVPLDDAADAYIKFDKRIDGYTKVILKP